MRSQRSSTATFRKSQKLSTVDDELLLATHDFEAEMEESRQAIHDHVKMAEKGVMRERV